MIRKKPELLIPAGSLDVLKVAVIYGADAVYLGGEAFGLRAKAKNFSEDEMREGIRFAHEHGVKVYVTANIFAHNADLPGVESYFQTLGDMGPDALIVSDPGVFSIARRVLPEMDIHISTQANNTNYETYRFWWELGAKRVVSARELTLAELAGIREHIPEEMEIESFVHGAMCISYSGRCLLSSFLAGHDANRGACTHPCRWSYSLMEETRPGEYFPVFENERGTYIFNSRDLCMIDHIPEMIKAGIDSFKVEGRMKTALYAACVTRAYRCAIDDYAADPRRYRERVDWYLSEVERCAVRPFTTGFYFGKPGEEAQVYEEGAGTPCVMGNVPSGTRENRSGRTGALHVARDTYLGVVEEVRADGFVRLEQKNKFSLGETIEVMKPDGRNLQLTVRSITDEAGEAMESAPHARQMLWVDLGAVPEPFDILRRREEIEC